MPMSPLLLTQQKRQFYLMKEDLRHMLRQLENNLSLPTKLKFLKLSLLFARQTNMNRLQSELAPNTARKLRLLRRSYLKPDSREKSSSPSRLSQAKQIA